MVGLDGTVEVGVAEEDDVGVLRSLDHHAGDAKRAGARVSLAPAFRDDVHDNAAAAFLPIVAARTHAVGAGGARPHSRDVERRRATQPERRSLASALAVPSWLDPATGGPHS